MSTLFSFGAGVIANTDYAAQSSDPALVAAETTDERLVLTPGNPPPAGCLGIRGNHRSVQVVVATGPATIFGYWDSEGDWLRY